MYNLRFYLDDNDNVVKCDYKEIYDSDEADLPFYNTLVLSQEELNEAFRILAKHDLNHESTVKKDYIIHEFVVPKTIMKSLIDKMREYKMLLDRDIVLKQKSKFNETIYTDNRKEKYKLRRKNKYKGVKIVTTIATAALLAGAVFSSIRDTKAYDKYNQIVEPNEAIEYHIKDEDVLTEDAIKTILDNIEHEEPRQYLEPTVVATETPQEEPDMTEMVEKINHDLDENQVDYVVDIEADDWTTTTKYINCYNNYNTLVTKYANMYGIDPKIALAIGCHERGEHSTVRDSGGAIGLFQVQVAVWDNQDVRAFNFNTNSWETFTVTEDKLRDLETNIKVGMMIFQECLRRDDYNITMAIQEYNFGPGGLSRVLSTASNSLGVPREVLEQNGNSDWFNFRTANKSESGYQYGDPKYIENVFKYINDGEVFHFTTPEGEQLTIKFHNLNNNMTLG